MEVWGACWEGQRRYRHKQVVWNGGNWGILGLSLDRQRPDDDLLGLQTLNPCQVHADEVGQWV